MITDRMIDQAHSDLKETCGGVRNDYFGLLVLERDYKVPREQALMPDRVSTNRSTFCVISLRLILSTLPFIDREPLAKKRGAISDCFTLQPCGLTWLPGAVASFSAGPGIKILA